MESLERELRDEITMRVRLAHQTLNLGVVLATAFIGIGALIVGQPGEGMRWLLLLAPLVFAGLLLNYQENIVMVRRAAAYLKETHKENEKWERWLEERRASTKVLTFFKMFIMVIPLFTGLFAQNLTDAQTVVQFFDIAILIFVLINFGLLQRERI
jgi:uncharacterized membrane protein YhaH (DUF805 family)